MISIVIPTYHMKYGLEFLKQSFDMLKQQTYKDFEVVVTDDSMDDEIRDFCQEEKDLPLRFIKNMGTPGMAGNTNTAMLYANGDLIKILYQDDRLYHSRALEVIAAHFKPKDNWLATSCTHTDGSVHWPTYSDEILKGVNTIGSPSVITIRKQANPILFNTKLTWVLDLDYYYRMKQKFGEPKLVYDINVIINTGDHQTTFNLSDERKLAEVNYLKEKYL